MKQISLQELKRQLSHWIDLARSGETILITKHNKPVAKLTTAVQPGRYIGKRFGKGNLKPLFDNLTKGEALRVLMEDRYGDPDYGERKGE
jgi:prevent-host-death family protein